MSGSRTGFPGGITLGPDQTNQAMLMGGKAAQGLLRIAASVIAAETVTIGGDVYRVAAVATDSTKTLGSELVATDSNNSPRATIAMAAHGLRAGDLIRSQNEIMLVLQALGPNSLMVQRAACGSSIATHAATQAIYTEAVPGGGGIAIGLNATLTPTAATPALVWAINNLGQERVIAYQIDVNTIVIASADKRGGTPQASLSAIATTETLTGVGNAWDAATLVGGRVPEMLTYASVVPSAAQVTAGSIVLIYPYTPVVEEITVRVTATAAVKAWDGAATVSGNKLTIDNAGAVDWAATDTIRVVVRPS